MATSSWLRKRLAIDTHWKNLLALSISITMSVCTTCAAQATQSTLYKDNGLGFASLSCVYIFCAIASFIAPAVIRFLGAKRTLVISLTCYASYIAANLYPTFYTLIPVSIIYGSSAGTLYTAQGTYLTSAAISYAVTTDQKKEHVISIFNGVYFMIYFIGISPGSVMLSLLLRNGQQEEESTIIGFNQSILASCGARDNCMEPQAMTNFYDNASNVDNYKMPSHETVTTVFVALLVVAVGSVLVAVLFVDQLHTFSIHKPDGDGKNGSKRLLRVAFSSKYLLLLPMIVLFSYDTAFFLGDVTKVSTF